MREVDGNEKNYVNLAIAIVNDGVARYAHHYQKYLKNDYSKGNLEGLNSSKKWLMSKWCNFLSRIDGNILVKETEDMVKNNFKKSFDYDNSVLLRSQENTSQRAFREANGDTQKGVAEMIGLSKAVVSKFERGVIYTSRKSTREKLRQYYGNLGGLNEE